MRRFRDSAGKTWDVVLGRESWGSVVALFVPEKSADPSRQAPLAANSYDAAVKQLDEFDDAALQVLLDRSTVKDEGQGA